MTRPSRQNPKVREFILRNVGSQPRSIATSTATLFGLSRVAINRYIKRLIDEGYIEATGRTYARRYSLKKLVSHCVTIDEITRHLSEDTIWRYHVLPHIKDVPQNVVDICQFAFTEIFNNVIDHSLSDEAVVSYEQTYTTITMMIIDTGVGIFQKIQTDFDLPDPRSALLELSKGKLTSDEERHTGEGIFFTSKMLDEFVIRSGDLFYLKKRDGDGWLIETGDLFDTPQGTAVTMVISTDATWTMRETFDEFQGDDLRFRKTHVPITLGKYPGEQLVSRSQAKRILARFDQFSEVILDFKEVEDIGPPFADEIFRIFEMAHPDTNIIGINMNANVKRRQKQAVHQPAD